MNNQLTRGTKRNHTAAQQATQKAVAENEVLATALLDKYLATKQRKAAGKPVTERQNELTALFDAILPKLTPAPTQTDLFTVTTTQEPTADERSAERFKGVSNDELIRRANSKADFKWDNEAYELERRHRTSNGQFTYEMRGNRLVNTSGLFTA